MSAANVDAYDLTLARWDLVLEDYFVAVTRYRWSRARNRGGQGRRAWAVNTRTADHVAHAAELRRLVLVLRRLGVSTQALHLGPPAADSAALARARRVARERIRLGDVVHGRCQCASPSCARSIPHPKETTP